MKELYEIQQKLEMKKERHNSFQNFDYWNMDDVLKKVRPILACLNCVLTFTDDLKELAGRVFIFATVTLTNTNTGESVSCCATAEISPERENGMSRPQMTGSASTYARKYALNGLFAINDERDSDEVASNVKSPARTRGGKQKTPVQPMMPIQGMPTGPAPSAFVDAPPVQPVQAPERFRKPKALTKEEYERIIYLSATCSALKNGEDPRQWYITTYNCGQKQIEMFDAAVNNLREEMMARMPDGREMDAKNYEQFASRQV